MARKRWRSTCGLTLFEVLLAILLLAVGATALVQSVVNDLKFSQQGHETLLAIRGAQECQLEFLRSQNFTSGDLSIGGPYAFGGSTCPTLSRLTGGQGRYRVDASPENGDTNNIRRVTIQVDWTDAYGRSRSSVMSALILRGGLGSP